MRQFTVLFGVAALLLGACAGSGSGEPLPDFVDAADRSSSCAEAVSAAAERRVRQADDPAAKQFAVARLDMMAETPPDPGNSVCFVAHIEESGDIRLNGIYTTAAQVAQTLRRAGTDPDIAYTYFRITNPPGNFSRKVVFDLSERLERLRIEGGLLTRFDARLRGEDKLDPASRATRADR